METNSKKKFNLKFVLGLLIPVLAIIIAIIMVSVSFAWFSRFAKAEIVGIKLTTQKSFILTFSSMNDSEDRNINYGGQKAIDTLGYIRSDYNGRVHNSKGGTDLETYLLDIPYYFLTTINLDTESSTIDMNMILDYVKIMKDTTMLKFFGEGGDPVADIPYLFTWYFKVHDENAVNYYEKTPGDEESRVMYNHIPTNEVWYTPYGKLAFDGNHAVTTVNDDISVTSSYSAIDNGLKNVRLNAANQAFDFYIVFAPEKLFWGQFFEADKDKNMSDLYTAAEIAKMVAPTAVETMMFYADMQYLGSVFEFGATLNVVAIDNGAGD